MIEIGSRRILVMKRKTTFLISELKSKNVITEFCFGVVVTKSKPLHIQGKVDLR